MIRDLANARTPTEFIQALTLFLIVLLINVIIIRFLWNTALVKHISILKPATTLLDTLLLAVALTILK